MVILESANTEENGEVIFVKRQQIQKKSHLSRFQKASRGMEHIIHRPIILFTCFSKALELTILDKIHPHVLNVLHDHQFEIKKKKLTVLPLLVFFDNPF